MILEACAAHNTHAHKMPEVFLWLGLAACKWGPRQIEKHKYRLEILR
jgi:hypothetical protein